MDAAPDSGTDACPDTDSDTDADTDSGTDTDTDTGTDTDSGPDASINCSLETELSDPLVFWEPGVGIHVFMAQGDFNEDGILDLVATQTYSIAVFLGNGADGVGDGTLGYGGSYATGENPYGFAVGDFDEDGILDLAVPNFLDNDVSVLLGNGTDEVGDGTFAAPVDYPVGESPYAINVADLDEDDILDLVTPSLYGTISILFGNGSDGVGDGTFAPLVTYEPTVSLPGYVEIADLDEDGILDLVVAGNSSFNVRVLYGNGVDGHADGTFALGSVFYVGDHPHTVVAADFNEDSHLDLAVSNYYSDDVSILIGTGETGDGAFEEQVVYEVGAFPFDMAVVDLDNDGVLDLAVDNGVSDTVGVLAGCGAGGIGDGTFGAQVEHIVPDGPRGIIAADFDEDGLTDLASAHSDLNLISILYGDWAE